MIPVVLFALVLLIAIWWTLRGSVGRIHGLDDIGSQLKPVDLLAFQNLVDPAQDEYLRRRLGARAFRRVQRARRLAAAEYLWQLARNAGLLIRAGEFARNAPNPQVAATAKNLVATAVVTRMLALMAMLRMSAGIAFPHTTARCDSCVRRYGLMTASYLQLGVVWRAEQRGT